MLYLVAVGCEPPAAESAPERFLAGVNALVLQQIGQVAELLATAVVLVDSAHLILLLALYLVVWVHHTDVFGSRWHSIMDLIEFKSNGKSLIRFSQLEWNHNLSK